MKLIMAGVHQRTTPLEVRGRLAFPPQTISFALESLRLITRAAFIISTCNRVEIYAIVADEVDGEVLFQAFLAQWHHLDTSVFAPYLTYYTEHDVIHHLFALAAGIDSVVLGEDQILSQIKEAHFYAKRAHSLDKILNRLLIKSLEVGKRIRTQTQIAQHHLSTVSIALTMLRQQEGSLAGKSIVVIGAGHIAELVLKHLHGTHFASLAIVNRTFEHAQTLATLYQGIARPFTDLDEMIRTCDVLISCAAVPQPLYTAATFANLLQQRQCAIVDLAVPHSIDPAIAKSAHIHYVDLDRIQDLADTNRAARSAEIEHAIRIIHQEVAAFLVWLQIQQVVPTISALRQRAEDIRQTELQKTLRRLGSLDERQQQLVQAMSVAIVNTLLHEPIASLRKAPDDAALAQAVNQLFQLPELRNNHVEHA